MATLVSADLLIDGRGGKPLRGAGVLFDGGRIVEVGGRDELRGRATDEVVFKGALLPGLADLHTHVVLSASADPAGVLLRESRTATVIRAIANLRRHLDAGVTTIRDVGGKDGIDLELRDAVNAGLIAGPRIHAAGEVICMTGGHACWVGIECDSPDQSRAAARRNLKKGVDHLKVIATGGVMTAGVEPGSPQLTTDEMKSVCDEAKKAGKHVAAHAQGTEGIRNALHAGVRTIEHGFYIDDATLPLFLETGAILVPTFSAADGIACGGAHGVPEFMVAKMQTVGAEHRKSFQRALAAGVQIAAGTDAGTPLNPHGSIAGELAQMVALGMAPMAAIRSATIMAATLLGRNDIGALEPGRRADLVVVDGDPLVDIAALHRVRAVWKDGVCVKHDSTPQESAASRDSANQGKSR